MKTVAELLAKKGRDVHTVEQGGMLIDATRMMMELGVGSLVVTDKGRVAGILTRNDVLKAFVDTKKRTDAVAVSEYMTKAVRTTGDQAQLADLREIMLAEKIHHMPVLRGETVVGLITPADILSLQLTESEQMKNYLEEYMFGPYF